MSGTPPDEDLNPWLQQLLLRAFGRVLDVDTAARHLWVFHRAAGRAARRRTRRVQHAVAAALTGLVVLSTSGFAVAASAQALPGDALYPLKRGSEQARLLVARAPQHSARLHLLIARTRLAEARAVVAQRPEVVPDLLAAAIDRAQHAQQIGGDQLAADLADVQQEVAGALADAGRLVNAPALAELQVAAAELAGAAAAGTQGAEPDPEATADTSAAEPDAQSAAAEDGGADPEGHEAEAADGADADARDPDAEDDPDADEDENPEGGDSDDGEGADGDGAADAEGEEGAPDGGERDGPAAAGNPAETAEGRGPLPPPGQPGSGGSDGQPSDGGGADGGAEDADPDGSEDKSKAPSVAELGRRLERQRDAPEGDDGQQADAGQESTGD